MVTAIKDWAPTVMPKILAVKQTKHFQGSVDDLVRDGRITASQLGDAAWSPVSVLTNGKRYALTYGPVTVIGMLDGHWMTLIEVVVRDAATVAEKELK